jgi:hypothetical protein
MWSTGIVAIVLACAQEAAPAPAPVASPAPVAVAPAVEQPVAQSSAPALEIVGAPLVGVERLDGNLGRSLWDLQDFDGLVFVGYGDGTANTGPTDVIAFDPVAAAFRTETTLAEEAVTTFRVVGDRLLVPGIDPVDDAEHGALYVRERGAWQTRRVPAAVHVFDAIAWDGRLFVALQQRPNRAVVLESRNDGASWRDHAVAGWRAHTFFSIDDGLYVAAYGGGVATLQGKTFRAIDTDLGPVPPPSKDGSVDTWAEDTIVTKAARCGAVTWIISAYGSVATGYKAPSLRRVRREGTELATSGAMLDGAPEDLFVWNDRCHAVTNETVDDATTIRIFALDDDGGELVAEAAARAIARSALRVGGDWYIGLGCGNGDCGEDAGKLGRLPATDD